MTVRAKFVGGPRDGLELVLRTVTLERRFIGRTADGRAFDIIYVTDAWPHAGDVSEVTYQYSDREEWKP